MRTISVNLFPSDVGTTDDAARAQRALRTGQKALISQLVGFFSRSNEARAYMKLYASMDRYSIVRVSGDVLHEPDSVTRVAAALGFLHRVGLIPVVVHGAGIFSGLRGERIRRAMAPVLAAEARGEAASAQALSDVMSAARDYTFEANASLVSALESMGVDAVAMPTGAFQVSADESATGAFKSVTGKITGVATQEIAQAVDMAALPVLGALGLDGERLLSFSTAAATRELAKSLKPLKVITLRRDGGLRNKAGDMIPRVSLAEDLARLTGLEEAPLKQRLMDEDVAVLDDMAALFRDGVLDVGSTASVTSPGRLADELFSNRGGGTLILPGERIQRFDSLEGLDLDNLRNLLEASFRAKLPASYFSDLSKRLHCVLLAESGRGAAIVTREAGLIDVPYLDKFAVHPSAQGEQLGEAVWRSLCASCPSFYWRSRTENPVNGWYFTQADGSYRGQTGTPKFTVFWRNLQDDDTVMRAVRTALSLPSTFVRTNDQAPLQEVPATPLPTGVRIAQQLQQERQLQQQQQQLARA